MLLLIKSSSEFTVHANNVNLLGLAVIINMDILICAFGISSN